MQQCRIFDGNRLRATLFNPGQSRLYDTFRHHPRAVPMNREHDDQEKDDEDEFRQGNRHSVFL